MKLISARQAWHDCYCSTGISLTSGAIDTARLGTVVQKTERANTTGAVAHHLLAGKVQAAIGTLPPALRGLGNYLYAPEPKLSDYHLAHSAVWFEAEGYLSDRREAKRVRSYFMVVAAIRSHQAGVLSGRTWGAAQICRFMAESYDLPLVERNFERDWSAVWSLLASAVDRLDAQALAPVAAVIESQRAVQEVA